MFIRNGEILRVEKADTDTEKWVQSKLREIIDSKKKYTFKATMRPVILNTDTGTHTDHRKIAIPAKTSFVNPITGMNETWHYIGPDTHIEVQQGGSIKVPHVNPFIIDTSGVTYRSDTKAEEIFFLMEISKSKKNRRITIEDKELEAKKSAERELMEATAKVMILSPDSIISVEKTGNNQALKNIASYFGVDNIESKSDSSLKIELWEAVKFCESNYLSTKKGYKELIEMANKEGDHEKRSTILLAINRGILFYDKSIWFVKLKGGGNQHIVSVPYDKESIKEDFLIRFLMNSEYATFFTLVEESLSQPEPVVIMNSNPKSGLNYAQLKKKVKEDLGWTESQLKGKKQVELERILANKQKP